MFIEIKCKEYILIPPERYTDDKTYGACGQNSFVAEITHQIQRNYANRVIVDQGFCITLSQIDEVGKGKTMAECARSNYDVSILDSVEEAKNGSSYFEVTFRLVVLRPYPQEVITGTVKRMDESGALVYLDFFPKSFWSVYIPANEMRINEAGPRKGQPMTYYPGEHGQGYYEYRHHAGDRGTMLMEKGQHIWFRVLDVSYPKYKREWGDGQDPKSLKEDKHEVIAQKVKKLNMVIHGSIKPLLGMGILGPCNWYAMHTGRAGDDDNSSSSDSDSNDEGATKGQAGKDDGSSGSDSSS